MKPEEFLKKKRIPKPTYEGVRLVDDKMGAYRIAELLEEYADIIRMEVNGIETSQDKALHKHIVSNRRELLAFIEEVASWDMEYSSTYLKMKAKKIIKANCC